MPAKQRKEPDSQQDCESRRLGRARSIFQQEAAAISALDGPLGKDFLIAVAMLLELRGNLLVTGIGKAGLIGQKLAATFASTGTPSHFVHPSEAVHGDLGRFQPSDIALVLSNSGETEEIVRLLPQFSAATSGVIAITARPASTLAKAAVAILLLSGSAEACSHNLAPTTSTAAMLAMGDALALVVSDERGFKASDFARFHPGGSLGKKLKLVDEVMRSYSECRIASVNASIREVLVKVARPGRRTGAVMLVDDNGRLAGLFTDSDLAKILERHEDEALDQPISNVMIRKFSAIQSQARMTDAIAILVQRRISELPVISHDDRPLGMIDITDVVAWQDSKDLFETTASNTELDSGINDVWSYPTSIRLFS
ncbi:MAG: KpsF/GutQ family sugar-phosphate isomerase [Pirellulaceae bacterium]|nr:KpsF/GutQ family sugar-phosphate isomerase [Pirellulaceae bacterium]